MTCIFHVLFSFVLLFNVSTCQSKTKVEKANENMTNPIVSEPLTVPIHINKAQDITKPTKIQTEQELKEYFIQTYKLPTKWEKRIKNVMVYADKKNQVIAISLDNKKKLRTVKKQSDSVFYLKESQENIPVFKSLNGVWRSRGSYMAISSSPMAKIKAFKKKGLKLSKSQPMVDESAKDKINEAIVQQQKVERLPKTDLVSSEISHSADKNVAKIMGEKVEKLFVFPQIKSQEIHQHIREALLNSKEGAMIILHKEYSYPKPERNPKVYVPEFKSRGFRFVRWGVELY